MSPAPAILEALTHLVVIHLSAAREYCRQKGLYPEQIASWRASCRQANVSQGNKINQKEVRHQAKEIKELKRELQYKDKELAETAALLVGTQKKSPHSFNLQVDYHIYEHGAFRQSSQTALYTKHV